VVEILARGTGTECMVTDHQRVQEVIYDTSQVLGYEQQVLGHVKEGAEWQKWRQSHRGYYQWTNR
jgi:hypothetical protein